MAFACDEASSATIADCPASRIRLTGAVGASLLFSIAMTGVCGATHRSSPQDAHLRVMDVSADGKLEVAIENASSSGLRLWKASSRWGYGRWRVLDLHDGFLTTYQEPVPRGSSKHAPMYQTINHGSFAVYKLDLNRWDWRWNNVFLPYRERRQRQPDWKIDFEPGDVIIVVYDVPISREARENGVWVGTAAVEVLKGYGG